MSQHDYNIANAGGAAVRSDINNALAAVQSLNSGSTAPTATKPFMPWYDTTTGALMMRNAGDTDWVSMAEAVGGGQLAGLRNRLINANFAVNQRGVSGTVTLAAGAYGHDRFKGGASGCTYTFSTVNNVTTLTISAGSLQQVIEGVNLETGTYCLSWAGTATGKIGAGSLSASGVTGSITGGTNTTIEFSVGTVSKVQLENNPVATPFEQRPYGMELALCQRYYYRIDPGSVNETFGPAFCSTTTLAFGTVAFPVVMRTAPSALEQSGVASDYKIFTTGGSSTNCSAVPTIVGSTTDITGVVTFTFASGLVAGNGGLIGAGTTTGANAYLGFSAEL